ncbi:MAG: WG repeat-containing protein [Polyangiaceae bacterium]
MTANCEAAGVIDRTAHFVVPPIYRSVSSYSGGRARADKESKWGFINKSGEWTVSPVFEEARGFSDGLAAVKFCNKWGFVRPDGTYLKTPQFEAVEDFLGGIAVVTCGDSSSPNRALNPYGYIDHTGKWLLPCSTALPFLAPITFADSQQSGGISCAADLSILILERRGLLRHYGIEELARLVRHRSPLLRHLLLSGAVDRLQDKYNEIFPPSEGLFVVRKDDRFGVINGSGNEVIPLRAMSIEAFSEGLATFNDGIICHPRRGFLNREGNVVIPAKYFYTGPFKDGLAAACTLERALETCYTGGCEHPTNYRCGFIDKHGNEVLPRNFSSIGEKSYSELPGTFSQSLAANYASGWGYIDRKGDWRLVPKFYRVRPFAESGLAPAATWPEYMTLDRAGNVIAVPADQEPPDTRSTPGHRTDTYSGWLNSETRE